MWWLHVADRCINTYSFSHIGNQRVTSTQNPYGEEKIAWIIPINPLSMHTSSTQSMGEEVLLFILNSVEKALFCCMDFLLRGQRGGGAGDRGEETHCRVLEP